MCFHVFLCSYGFTSEEKTCLDGTVSEDLAAELWAKYGNRLQKFSHLKREFHHSWITRGGNSFIRISRIK